MQVWLTGSIWLIINLERYCMEEWGEEIVLTLIVQLILPYDAISIPMTPFTIQNDLKRPVLTSDIPHCFIPATSSGNTGAASLSK